MSAPSSLVDVMQRHAAREAPSAAVHFWNTGSRAYEAVSYADLVQRSFAFGSDLQSEEQGEGSVCLIACHSPYASLIAFYGAVSAGAIPMIFPMPRALGSHQALVERIHHWGSIFSPRCMLVIEEGVQEKFHQDIPVSLKVARVGQSPAGNWDRRLRPVIDPVPCAADIAFYQTTSSSTGDHKAVAISHGNILSNVAGIRAAVGMHAEEKMISWLPLFHDMGLVGAVLFSFCHGYPLYLMTPTQFIKRPVLWLKGMSEHGCTITTAPNFGYDYCNRLVSDKDANALDLSGAKHFFIGAEPVRVSTIRDFCRKFGARGVTPEKIRPAYGLAESTIITTISRPGQRARFAFLEPDSIGVGDRVRVLGEAAFPQILMGREIDAGPVAVCTAGRTIDGMQVELVDDDGRPVHGDGYAGEIVIRGQSVALGYVRGGEEPIDRFVGQEVGTGDMGVMLDGDLFIIERIKNVIIRNGENFLVSAMEQRLADLLGMSHENVAVFESNIHDPSSAIVVLAEKHKELDPDQINGLLANLPQENFPIDLILFHRARAIPRTTSGKKRHFYCRKLFQKGELEHQQAIEVSPDRIAQASLSVERGG